MWALTVWMTVAGVAGLVPVTHAQANRPVLIVGGHFTPQASLDDAAEDMENALGLPAGWASGIELLSFGPLWPGTASNEDSADAVHTAIDALLAYTSASQVDVVAISQGALVTRWLVKNNTTARSKVAGLISFGGVNAGIPDSGSLFSSIVGYCEDFDLLEVCEEMVYDLLPGWTTWLLTEVNNGDPTPGSIDYYHLYTANDPNTPETTEVEAITPYGWSVPLPGATNISAQQACQAHISNRPAPHAGVWPDGEIDVVMQELLLDALNRVSLSVPASLCQTVQW